MDGLILDYYGIAEESVSFDGIKKRIDQIIITVRNWIQRVVNWVSIIMISWGQLNPYSMLILRELINLL